MVTYIYSLSDPKQPTIVRYVGQTHSLSKRLKQHSTCKVPVTCTWISSLCGPPTMAVLEETDTFRACEREAYWIGQFQDLLNVMKPNHAEYAEQLDSGYLTLKDLQFFYVKWVYAQFGGNKQATAKALGMSRPALYEWLARNPDSRQRPPFVTFPCT